MAAKPYERAEELELDDDIKKACSKLYEAIAKGFDDQRDRADRILDNWDMYECQLGRFQNYSGMTRIFVPIVRNGVNALVTRYVNQSFPSSGRHVECITGEEEQPYALLSLIEHYIDAGKLRTMAARELLLNGQIEGQYNAYFHWDQTSRVVVSKDEKPITIQGAEHPELGMVEMMVEEEIDDACPTVEVLHDNDVLVLPATAASVEDALEMGGCAVVVRRWTEATIEKMAADGEIDEDAADDLIHEIGQAASDSGKIRDAAKALAASAGIQLSRGKIFAQVWECWAKLEIEGKRRLCKILFTGEKKVASARRNPYWNDRCPLRSAPVKKMPGVFKGEPPVFACQDMQILANDMANEAADQMYYVGAPIVAVDPNLVTKWKELVTDVAAVWPVKPGGVEMIQWPNRARECFEIIQDCKAQIFETLGVNPGMLPQQTGAKAGKRNQAEIALEQQVDLLQTSDAVTVFEQEILSPYVQWSAELDHQFRDKDILVREFGELGFKASMERIKPIQWGKRWSLRWVGVEASRNAQMIQQQIGLINVIKQIPPQMMPGYTLNVAPAVERAIGNVFGPMLGRLVFRNVGENMGVDPKIENDMLAQGFEVLTHIGDNDALHIQAHMKAPPGPSRDEHIKRHQLAMAAKAMAQAPPGPPGSAPGPGPRPGAQPGPQKPVQGPPGMIRPDAMPKAGAIPMPRRM